MLRSTTSRTFISSPRDTSGTARALDGYRCGERETKDANDVLNPTNQPRSGERFLAPLGLSPIAISIVDGIRSSYS